MLGGGAPLLPRRIATPPMKLVSAQVDEAGFLQLHYMIARRENVGAQFVGHHQPAQDYRTFCQLKKVLQKQ
jgi:hypothetical protein